MKKVILLIATVSILLAGCGGNMLGLDLDKVHQVAYEHMIDRGTFEAFGYTEEEDLEVYKICEAVQRGSEEDGHQGYYIVYWQTADGEQQRELLMKDYQEEFGIRKYDPLKDRCMEVN